MRAVGHDARVGLETLVAHVRAGEATLQRLTQRNCYEDTFDDDTDRA